MKEIHKRYVKEFLDIIILSMLKDKSMCGYDIILTMHENFKMLLSPGTVYPVLHSLKESGLVKWKRYGKEKIYTITNKGKSTLKNFSWVIKNLKLPS